MDVLRLAALDESHRGLRERGLDTHRRVGLSLGLLRAAEQAEHTRQMRVICLLGQVVVAAGQARSHPGRPAQSSRSRPCSPGRTRTRTTASCREGAGARPPRRAPSCPGAPQCALTPAQGLEALRFDRGLVSMRSESPILRRFCVFAPWPAAASSRIAANTGPGVLVKLADSPPDLLIRRDGAGLHPRAACVLVEIDATARRSDRSPRDRTRGAGAS